MKKQKVNWILYLILGFLSLIIIAVSLCIKDCMEWFTIVSGIGCGAFASVLIAYLIELANVSQKKRKNVSVFESYFCDLYFNFAFLFSSFVIVCDKDKKNDVGELHWFEWLEKIAEEQTMKPVSSAKDFLIGKLKDVGKEFEKIEKNKLLLLGQDLVDDVEIVALANVKLDLSVIESELGSLETNWIHIKSIIPELKADIERSKVLKKFNSALYKDGLSKLMHIRCYLN